MSLSALAQNVAAAPADSDLRSRSPVRSPVGSPARMGVAGRAVLRCVRLSQHAVLPTRGSKEAAGYDLYSAHDCVVPARGKSLVKTDIQVKLPEGCYGRVAPRSGLAWKQHIDIGAGVIDRDYRGNVGVVMFNHGEHDMQVKRGDRVAQLILERIFYPDIEEVENLDPTERGESGFGSTGKD